MAGSAAQFRFADYAQLAELAKSAVMQDNREAYIALLVAMYAVGSAINDTPQLPRMSADHALVVDMLPSQLRDRADSLVAPIELYRCREDDAAYTASPHEPAPLPPDRARYLVTSGKPVML